MKLFWVKLIGSYAFGVEIIRARDEEQARNILHQTSGHLLDEDGGIYQEVQISELTVDGDSGVVIEGYYIE